MARKQTTEGMRVIHTPAGMHVPPQHGEAADGADIASTDMSVDPGGSRADPLPAGPRSGERGAAGVQADVAGRLLDALDDLERLASSDASAQTLRAGLGEVEGRLRDALAAAGVVRVGGASRERSVESATITPCGAGAR